MFSVIILVRVFWNNGFDEFTGSRSVEFMESVVLMDATIHRAIGVAPQRPL